MTTRIQLDLTPKEIEQLRDVMDAQPLRPYAPLILKVLNALPLESDACPAPGADSSRPAPASVETGRGFSLTQCTSGSRVSEALRSVLERLPHGDSF